MLLGAGYVSAHLWGHRPMDARESPFLGSSGRQTLVALGEALLPTPEDAAWAAEAIDDFLAQGDPVLSEQMRLALGVLEHWPGGLRFSRFSRLSIPERQQVLKCWAKSMVGARRQIAAAMNKAVLFTHYARPESWAAIGYPGPMEAN